MTLTFETAKSAANATWINNLIACSLSILLNLIWLIVLFRTKRYSSFYRIVLSFITLLELIFSTLFIVACPIFATFQWQGFNALLIVNAGLDTSPGLSIVLLMSSLVMLTQQIFHSPVIFFFRYLQVCRKGVYVFHVLLILSSTLLCLFLSTGLLCYASFPTDSDELAFSGYATAYAGHPTTYLVLSYDKDDDAASALLSGVIYFAMLFASVVIMLFCYFRIKAKIASSPNMSENLKRMQKTSNSILGTHFLLTIIFIQVPFVYSVLGPIVGLSKGFISFLISILFVWGPVANVAVLFAFQPDVRRDLFICACAKATSAVGDRSANRSDVK